MELVVESLAKSPSKSSAKRLVNHNHPSFYPYSSRLEEIFLVRVIRSIRCFYIIFHDTVQLTVFQLWFFCTFFFSWFALNIYSGLWRIRVTWTGTRLQSVLFVSSQSGVVVVGYFVIIWLPRDGFCLTHADPICCRLCIIFFSVFVQYVCGLRRSVCSVGVCVRFFAWKTVGAL